MTDEEKKLADEVVEPHYPTPNTNNPMVGYAIRKWDAKRNLWQYCGDSFNYDVWVDSEHQSRTTTSLVSAMFIAQQKAHETKDVVYVVLIEEPKTVWSTHFSNRKLELEDIKKHEERYLKEVSNAIT